MYTYKEREREREREIGNRGAQEHISEGLWARILHENDFLSQSS